MWLELIAAGLLVTAGAIVIIWTHRITEQATR